MSSTFFNLVHSIFTTPRNTTQTETKTQNTKTIVLVGEHPTFTLNSEIVPDEVTLLIFGFLDPEALSIAARVCTHWQKLATEDCLWKIHAAALGFEKPVEETMSYKAFYTKCIQEEDGFLINIYLKLLKYPTKDSLRKQEAKMLQWKHDLQTNMNFKKYDYALNKKLQKSEKKLASARKVYNESKKYLELKSMTSGISLFSKEKHAILLKLLGEVVEDLNEIKNQDWLPRLISWFRNDPHLYSEILFIIVVKSGALSFLKELVKEGKAVPPTQKALDAVLIYDLIAESIDCSYLRNEVSFKMAHYLLNLGIPFTYLSFKTLIPPDSKEKKILLKVLCQAVAKSEQLPIDWDEYRDEILNKITASEQYQQSYIQRQQDRIDKVSVAASRSFLTPCDTDRSCRTTLYRSYEDHAHYISSYNNEITMAQNEVKNAQQFIDAEDLRDEILPLGYIGEMQAVGLLSDDDDNTTNTHT